MKFQKLSLKLSNCNFYKIVKMEKDYRVHFKFKLEYLKLALEISILRFQGFDPRESLLKKARELGRLAKVSEHEIKNL